SKRFAAGVRLEVRIFRDQRDFGGRKLHVAIVKATVVQILQLVLLEAQRLQILHVRLRVKFPHFLKSEKRFVGVNVVVIFLEVINRNVQDSGGNNSVFAGRFVDDGMGDRTAILYFGY